MKTIFTQQEIQQALVNYMELQGIVVKNRNITVSFEKGRGPNALSAVVDIEDPSNIFLGKPAEPVKEQVAEDAPVKPEPEEVKDPVPEKLKEDPPFIPDEPEEQAGSSAPPSGLPKAIFGRSNV